MSNHELITVYITTFNRLDLLKRAVASVLCQTYRNFELLIVDDNSNDGTKDYLNKVQVIDPRIRVLAKPKNSRGVQKSRNLALSQAKGKFITGLDDDDFFHPRRLEILISNYNENYSCVSSNWMTIGRSQTVLSSYVGRKISTKDLFLSNKIGSQVFTETYRLLEIGGFDETLQSSQDLDTWIRLVRRFGKALRVSSALYFMDISHESERISTSDNKRLGNSQFIEKYKNEIPRGAELRRLEMSDDIPKTIIGRLYRYRRYGVKAIKERILVKLKLG